MYTSLDMGKWIVYYNLADGSFHTKKLCSRLYSIELEYYSQKRQIRFLSRPLGELGVGYALYLQLVGKRVFDFLFAIVERFSLALTVQTRDGTRRDFRDTTRPVTYIYV